MESQALGQYEVTEELWRGARGLAAYCVDAHTGRRFLMKEVFLPAEAEERERWLAAVKGRAEAWASAAWPGVASLVRMEEEGRLVRLLYDDTRGLCVRRLAEEAHALLPGQACRAVLRITERVDELRRGGAEIRSFEPQCAFMVSDDECVWADVSVNEIALAAGAQAVEAGDYAPPELAKGKGGEAGERALVYALGVLLHRLLTGRGPGEVEADTPLWALNPQVSSALDRLVRRAVAAEPRQRYASLNELMDALHRLPEEERYHPPAELEEEAVGLEAQAALAEAAKKRRAVLWVAGIGMGLLCVAAVALVVSRTRAGHEAEERVAPPIVGAHRRRVGPVERPAPAAAPVGGAQRSGGAMPAPEVRTPKVPVRGGAVGPGVRVGTEGGATEQAPPKRAAQAPLGPAQEGGGLRVVVNPPGAEVYVDGTFVGTSGEALLVPGLAPGRHEVRVQMDGYAPETRNVSVPKGGTGMLSVTLRQTGPGG